LDDQSAPVLSGTLVESKSALSSRAEAIGPPNHEASLRDWYFEPNFNSRKVAPINRLVGESRTMMELRVRISRYARTEATVLISGETGTGKELIARILHDLSPRNKSPFVAINCAAIPGPLAESELFGSTRGAFTGAVQCRNGLLARANSGTLFLDEFGELIPEVQSKLLRVLELGVYCPVGSNREERADVRIIAATNRDLERSVLRGEFRADLYYRINVLQIAAPPLRKHRGDIPHIVGEILGELLPKGSRLRITEHVMAELLQAPWPGNVRELKNVLHRSLVMSSGKVIERLECDPQHSTHNLPTTQGQSETVERLIDALMRNKGRLEAIAHELDVSVRTVQRRMKENGLRLRDFRNI
jgi:two-component system response regulator AtoC